MKQFLFAVLALLLSVVSVSAQNSYRLKPGDTLTVEVLEDPQLNRSVLVLPDGSINFPFAGQVSAAGRTVGQVQQAITSGIAPNFASPPTVFVTVSGLVPESAPLLETEETINVFFTGEVRSPGLIEVAPGTTFLQAFALNGGLTEFAATKRVQLRRTDPSTLRQAVYVINYRALSDGAAMPRDIVLRDGDVILVPERRLFE
ncbi:polysaccharide biosynthesis/export family protein [Poseidonocella sedimentorum]|uniref:Polysaccharide export outer membrane protein n=1 Tax=Poseidonocella sedimentorum TaxID=871652 RepID=A0A1I6EP47_9RHOB|nr:polysaccharide biosynthesis/export family protein [Poseidonocella sedimentorum]SFR19272.1 polysaccharide export outer membrane protein [Poseidonocella sedimentorum]